MVTLTLVKHYYLFYFHFLLFRNFLKNTFSCLLCDFINRVTLLFFYQHIFDFQLKLVCYTGIKTIGIINKRRPCAIDLQLSILVTICFTFLFKKLYRLVCYACLLWSATFPVWSVLSKYDDTNEKL